MSTAYTAHPCTTVGQTRCSGSNCTSGYCDSAGCDFNPYRLGNKTFYGRGMTIDTTRKITVVTQFIIGDSTSKGALSEIRRLYIQNGKVIQNAKTSVPGMATFDSITEPFCAAERTAFGEPNDFAAKGGFRNLGSAFGRGMVLSMSVSDDYERRMLWLDSTYPIDADPSKPGIGRGTCSTGSGVPADIEVIGSTSSVTFSNIRFGDIGSTYSISSTSATTVVCAFILTTYSRAHQILLFCVVVRTRIFLDSAKCLSKRPDSSQAYPQCSRNCEIDMSEGCFLELDL